MTSLTSEAHVFGKMAPKLLSRNLKCLQVKAGKKKVYNKIRWTNKFQIETDRSKHSIERVLVPWMTTYEWQTVKQKIFSPQLEDKIAAVNRLAVWKSRCHGNIPLGIEVTDALLRAYIQDCNCKNSEEAQILHGNLVMMYSSAIVRFVNLVTEMGQKGTMNTPVHILAKKMQIPEWLVEMRHEASHTNFPALSTLQAGFHLAMNWIEKNYWNKESVRMSDLHSKEPLDEFLASEKLKFISPSSSKHKLKSWELAKEEIEWGNYPLGILPSQIEELPFLDLSLPVSVDKLYSHQAIVLSCNTAESIETESIAEDEDKIEMPSFEDRLHITKLTKSALLWTDEQLVAIQRSLIIF